MGIDSLSNETMYSTLFAIALQLSVVTAVFRSIQFSNCIDRKTAVSTLNAAQ